MKILGLSFHGHDASAALVVDGKVIASAAEERYSRQKHDPSFPLSAIEFCLRQGGLTASELDFVAYHEDPILRFSRSVSAQLASWPRSFPTFFQGMKESLTTGIWVRHAIASQLDIDRRKIVFIPHHFSHAAHAFYTSPFGEAAILTVDAVGEWTSTAIFKGRKDDAYDISPLAAVPYPHSLGLVYSAFTGFLGFQVNSEECSTMALAGFGKPLYLNQVRQIIKLDPQGTYTVDSSYFDFSSVDALPITDKFKKVFGEPRDPSSPLPFDCLTKKSSAEPKEQNYANIAASVQQVLEESVLHLARRAQELSGARTLCLAGGVALNCVANNKIVESKIFDQVFIPPDPGDGGGALGAALYLGGLKNEKLAAAPPSVYLGEDPELENLEKVAKTFFAGEKIAIKRLGGSDEVASTAALLVSKKKIVGWLQGRFEMGPRALGARSLLADPGDIGVAERLSRSIKHRASFRPYACSMTESAAAKMIENGLAPAGAWLNRWMLATVQVKDEARQALTAATHVDGTTRVQIVRKEDNPLFHLFLEKLGTQAGLEAVLNTSFNERGYPLVNTPYDALLTFARTPIDALIIGDLLLERT